jgi:hypothetical protein
MGPKVRALTKIIMSPKLMYPPVAGTGIWIKKVATATRAAMMDDSARITAILSRSDCSCMFCKSAFKFYYSCRHIYLINIAARGNHVFNGRKHLLVSPKSLRFGKSYLAS